jgi:Fic family protein
MSQLNHRLERVLIALRHLAAGGQKQVASPELSSMLKLSPATVGRHLEQLLAAGLIDRTGQARSTRYALSAKGQAAHADENITARGIATTATVSPSWTGESAALKAMLLRPLAARTPITYVRQFVDRYVPNETALLPPALAIELAEAGRMHGQQPAGTYARKVLEQLLIDLSWSSSRLEGNRYSLLDTAELFASGVSTGDADAIMLLNHKQSIEFLVDAVPEYGLSASVVRNLHAILMQDLLPDSDALGTIRQKVVNISGTVYVPAQIPSLLEEMFESMIDKARLIKNPLESAFFLWVNLAYLQPFEDGNKRTSRLAANVPLMLYNCAPLSFIDVDIHDYALAMMGVYEHQDVSMAVDIFAWTYRRSLEKYVVVLESMGGPDPARLRYREALNEAMQLVVRERKTVDEVLAALHLEGKDDAQFRPMLTGELRKLEGFNCARYRLTMRTTQDWIDENRPQ